MELGIAMTVEDTWGGDITTAAILHLSHIVAPKLQFTVTDFNSYNKVKSGNMNGVSFQNGRMTLPTGPGLGVVPEWTNLGEAIIVIQ